MGEDGLQVTFYDGKGVRARGPYTVHTIPIEFREEIEAYLHTKITHLFPSSLKGEHLKDALRLENPLLEQRSTPSRPEQPRCDGSVRVRGQRSSTHDERD